jgi:hypothetical protein
VSLTFSLKPSAFLFFTRRDPRRWAALQSSGELAYRLIRARTGALLWPKPNSGSNERFPQPNSKNAYRVGSGHGDRGRRGQLNVFPVIGGFLVQLGGSTSITGTWEHLNEGSDNMIWPESRWPRWGCSCGGENRIGRSMKLELSGDWLRTILGGWVRGDPTELTVASIYSKNERWPGIWVMTRGGRRSGRLLAQWIGVQLSWQSLRRATESYNWSRRCDGGVQIVGARPWDGGHQWAHPIPPWWVRYDGRNSLLAGVIHSDDICVTLSAIQQSEHESPRRNSDLGASSPATRCIASLIFCHCTMGSSIQCAWQPRFRVKSLSNFYGNSPKALQQSCRPMIQLQYCHNNYSQIPTR